MMTTGQPGPNPADRQVSTREFVDRLRGDAHLESSIPGTFLWVFDVVALCLAYAVNLILAPRVQHLFTPGGALRFDSLNWLTLPEIQLARTPSLLGGLALLALTGAATVAVVDLLGGYQGLERASRVRVVATPVVGVTAGLSAFALLVFGLRVHGDWSRVFIFVYALLAILLLAGYRLFLRSYKRRRMVAGRYARATAFVGRASDIALVLARLDSPEIARRFRMVGSFSVDELGCKIDDLPDLGPVDRLESIAVHTPIDLLVIVQPDEHAPWFADAVRACDYLRIATQIVPLSLLAVEAELRDLRAPVMSGPLPLPGVALKPWDADLGSLFIKRVFDAVVASALLLLLSPLLLVIALLLKITSPRQAIFYRWNVVGYKGRPFTGYKFTTMVDDAEQKKAELMHLNEMSGPVFKIKRDPRITPLGRALRKFSLNELPQLWSVVKGDMSLVGPRPAGNLEIGHYEDWHKRKLSVRPGITCLWQVRGRNKISCFDDWVRMDLEYIDNWSLWLDIKILFRTVAVVLAGSGS